MQFEVLRMKEEENISAYFLQVDEIVNSIRGLGENVDEESIVQKILRTLTPSFNSKASILEDIDGLEELTKHELHVIIIEYEIDAGESSSKFIGFWVSNPCKHF